MDSSQYRGPVVDLVDPYTTTDGAEAALENLSAWLHAHPGRWALFCDGEHGVDPVTLKSSRMDFEVARRASKTAYRKVYARVRHPEGESLDEALSRTRGGRPVDPEELPRLTKDTFSWTKEELEAACRAAKESLFPVRALRGSGGRK